MRAGRLAAWVLGIWLVLPLVPVVIWTAARGWRFPDLLPADWSGRAMAQALSPSSGVPQALFTGTALALAVTAIALALGIPAGRALGLARFRGKRAVEVAILAPLIVPPVAYVFGLQALFLRLGLAPSAAGVALAHLVPVLPYVILVMAAVFAGHDTRLEEEARSLGASPAQVFVLVTLPAVGPSAAVAALLAFLVSWGQYLPTLAIGGGRVATPPLALYAYISSGRHDIAAAIAVLSLLPGLAVIWLTRRAFPRALPVPP